MGIRKQVNDSYQIIHQQMETFNYFLINRLPDLSVEEEQEELKRISDIVQAALGAMEGVLGISKNDHNTSPQYTLGRGIGSLIGSGLTQIASAPSFMGAGGAFVTKNKVWFLLGIEAGIFCCALNCIVAPIFLNYLGYNSYQAKENLLLRHEELLPLYNLSLTIQEVIHRYLNSIKHLDTDFVKISPLRESRKCLQLYKSLPDSLKMDDVYFRMLSIFLQKLPPDHPICDQLDKTLALNFEKHPFRAQVASGDEKSLTIILEEGNDADYSQSLKKCHQLIREAFQLKPTKTIKFIEMISKKSETLYRMSSGGVQEMASSR